MPHTPTCECISSIKCSVFLRIFRSCYLPFCVSIICFSWPLMRTYGLVSLSLFFYCFVPTSQYFKEGGGGKCVIMCPNKYSINWREKNLCRQAPSSMNLQNHRWLPVSIFRVKIAALGSLKRVICKAKNLSLTTKQKIIKTISACKASTYSLL